MELREVRVEQADVGGAAFDSRGAMNMIDEVITDIYLPFRGAEGYKTERAILVNPPHAEHRENDAEHSWSIALMALALYDNREKLNLEFPEDFDIERAVVQAIVHDVIEIKSGDVDAMTRDPNLLALKALKEQAGLRRFMRDHPNLAGIMARWQVYEERDQIEDRFISDIDKIFATRMIYVDEGKKWHGFDGYKTAREDMSSRIRGKLLTDMGHKLMDVLEADIDANPHLFPYQEAQPGDYQLAFDLESLT